MLKWYQFEWPGLRISRKTQIFETQAVGIQFRWTHQKPVVFEFPVDSTSDRFPHAGGLQCGGQWRVRDRFLVHRTDAHTETVWFRIARKRGKDKVVRMLRSSALLYVEVSAAWVSDFCARTTRYTAKTHHSLRREWAELGRAWMPEAWFYCEELLLLILP